MVADVFKRFGGWNVTSPKEVNVVEPKIDSNSTVSLFTGEKKVMVFYIFIAHYQGNT